MLGEGEGKVRKPVEVSYVYYNHWLLSVAVARLHDGDLHDVGWGEGP